MKRNKLLLLIFALLCSALLLASCGDEEPAPSDDNATAHTHSYEVAVTEPTCTTEGYTTYTCECGHSYVNDRVPISHDYTWHTQIKTQPTCEESGVMEYFCECGASITEEIPSKGHSYYRTQTETKLTCTQDGVTKKFCDCGHTEIVIVKAEGHKLETTTTPATCNEDGISITKCLNCPLANSEEILYASHKVGTDGVCTVCSKTIWAGEVDTSWYSESESSFTITTAAQLAGFSSLVNAGNTFEGKTVMLGGNIYLGDRDWTAIGNKTNVFAGTFNGCGFTVSGFIYREVSGVYLGLFGYNCGEIKNLSISDCRVRINVTLNSSTDDFHFGAIAAYNAGAVNNCTADVDVSICVVGTYYVNAWIDVGAIVGDVLDGGVVYNCQSSGEIIFNGSYCDSLQLNVGGAVGYTLSGSTVNKTESKVDIKVNNLNATTRNSSYIFLGGFVGYNMGAITNSYATGSVLSEHTVYSSSSYVVYIGGFVGSNSSSATISSSYATGSVTHKIPTSDDTNHVQAGGFVAYTEGDISTCYATGTVTVDCGKNTYSIAGGFAAQVYAATLEQCYSTGEVSDVSVAECITGGFVGYISNNGIVKNCYSTSKVYHKTSGLSSYVCTYAGGLVGILRGSVVNCYATGNVMIICEGDYYAVGGGLVGLASTQSTVSACFCTGDVYAKGTTKLMSGYYNMAGAMFGQNENITFNKCYYKKDQDLTFNSSVTVQHAGNPLGLGSFMTIAFVEKTLGWSTDIWSASDEALPTLTAFNETF